MHPRTLDDFINLAHMLLSAAQAAGERRMLVVSGHREMSFAAVGALWRINENRTRIWVGAPVEAFEEVLSASQALKTLGNEYSLVVFDAWAGFHPDAFCALTGALVGGGLVIVLTPPLTEWVQRGDPDYVRMLPFGYGPAQVNGYFLQRVSAALCNGAVHDGSITIVEIPADGLPEGASAQGACCLQTSVAPGPMLYQQAFQWPLMQCQGEALRRQDEILRMLSDAAVQLHAPIIITADRGRGKSSLLGRLAAHLSASRHLHVAVTAANPLAVTQARRWAEREAQVMGSAAATLPFLAPDNLLAHAHALDVLLVDEAAMLPVSLLQQLILRYPRIVLASTVHGYEGSGRGLALKLIPWLDRVKPGWQALTLTTPMRWREGDPLERWLTETFCLGDDVITPNTHDVAWEVHRVSTGELAQNEGLLHRVFGLLVAAHYRTTPSDLRDLLDGPNLVLWVLRHGDQVAGVCLVACEGLFDDPALCAAILAGKRRPRGHLLPQSIAFHCHSPLALRVCCARVVRIAITPALQARGWGRRMLEAVEHALHEQGVEWFGTSFALEPAVLRFWQKAGMRVLRIGATRESASGLPSCLMAKSLRLEEGHNVQACDTVNELGRLVQQFEAEAPTVIPIVVPALSSDAVAALSLAAPSPDPERYWQALPLDSAVVERVQRFVKGALPFESALGALQRWWVAQQPLVVSAVGAVRATETSGDEMRGAVTDLLLGRCNLGDFARHYQLAGRNAVIQRLRDVLAATQPRLP